MSDDYTFIVDDQTNPEDSPYRSHVEVNGNYYIVSTITHGSFNETMVFTANIHGEVINFTDLMCYAPANHTAALTYLRHCASAHTNPEDLLELETDPYDEHGDEWDWDWDVEGEDIAYEDQES